MLPELLKDVKSFFVPAKKVYVDNFIFRLFYKFTMGLLIASSVLVIANDLIGKNIYCINELEMKAIDTYCYIFGTYTIENHFHKDIGEEVAADGVGPHTTEGDELVKQNYYMWVHMVLFLQGITFYIGRLVWKSMDNSKAQHLVGSLTDPSIKQEDAEKYIDRLVDYFTLPDSHRVWYLRYIGCEVLNVIILFLNFSFTNWFLNDRFWSYGHLVMQYFRDDDFNGTSPLRQVFPRSGKCTFYMYGTSGTIEKHDQLCILPQNIINEKIYLVIWFWFVILVVVSLLQLIFRVLTFSTWFREKVTVHRDNMHDKDDLITIVQNVPVGTWFLVALIKNNISLLYSTYFVEELAKKLDKSSYSKSNDVKSIDEKQPLYNETI